MRILQVNKFFDLKGGAEVYMHDLAAKQRELGHEVNFFSTLSANNLPSQDEKFFVHRADYSRSEGWYRDIKKGMSFVWNREAKRGMARCLKEFKPDVVHLHNIYHHLSSSILDPIKKSKIPCVQTLHDYKLACPNYKMFVDGSPCERCKGGRYLETVKHHCLWPGMAGNVMAAAEMGMTKFWQLYESTIDFFICPSKFMANKMIDWGEPPSKMKVVSNVIDGTSERVISDGDYFLAVGRLSIEKGFDVLIRAAAKNPKIKIKFAGTGPDAERLQQLAKIHEVTGVEFLGFLSKKDLAEKRKHARALLVPSIWYENAPLVVLEAMSQGLPIIASQIGGLPEYVEHERNGFLVQPKNVDAWRKALERFLELNQEDLRKMSDQCLKDAEEKYSWDKHLKSLLDIYVQAGAKN